MKKLALSLAVIGALTLCACSGGKSNTETQDENTEHYDSLRTALAEKDSLMALVSEISDGMNQIKEMENLLNASNLTQETPNKKEQILSDMTIIQQALAERRQRLDELEARLKKSSNYSDEMKRTISSLKEQIASQEKTINDLNEQLKAANMRIDHLNTSVDSLKKENTQVANEKKAAQDESVRLTNELNTCYYVIGSKSELKKNKIIEAGFLKKTKVMESDYELSYFTRADKRTLNEVPLHAKKAKVLSKHPSGSYSIVDTDGSKTLVINNATKFWELSNFLIIQIN